MSRISHTDSPMMTIPTISVGSAEEKGRMTMMKMRRMAGGPSTKTTVIASGIVLTTSTMMTRKRELPPKART
ncbi:MAG: hypothetical protein H0U59_05415 [Gemmatimonadaceae bacterium]|nr:hypothetical protein [Gemmatimonadaceae bacterium]MDQ3243745.1 hypothetical protein [Gemmatimonadota bacterium]